MGEVNLLLGSESRSGILILFIVRPNSQREFGLIRRDEIVAGTGYTRLANNSRERSQACYLMGVGPFGDTACGGDFQNRGIGGSCLEGLALNTFSDGLQ